MYTFEVDRNANKDQIRNALESIYDVTVVDVRTAKIKGKAKRTGKRRLSKQQPDGKKALITLQKDQTIKLFDLEG